MFSRLRWVVSLQLAKAYRLGVGVVVSRIVRVFNLNSGLVYRFLRELESEGLVERSGRGLYRVRDSGRASKWVEFILSSIDGGVYEYLSMVIPEIYYYITEPPSIEWLGYPDKTLIVIDKLLEGRIDPPEKYRVVYTDMRGRVWRYDWDRRVSIASPEQALADLLSYDPEYPVEQYILLNIDNIDLWMISRKTTIKGLRRLSTFLAYLRISTGKIIKTPFNYVGLIDEKLLSERLGEYSTLIFTNGIDVKRNI